MSADIDVEDGHMTRLATAGMVPDPQQLDEIARLLYWLMLRNVAGDGIVYVDPLHGNPTSVDGCIVASPSYPGDDATVTTQDYVYNWTRDAAIVATQILLSGAAYADPDVAARLSRYLTFAALCQANAGGDLSNAVYLINGKVKPEPWRHQNDGPALQGLTVLAALDGLGAALGDQDTATAHDIVAADLAFVLGTYPETAGNLWEEVDGFSFFTRAVQLRFLTVLRDQHPELVPAGTDLATPITALGAALDSHWNPTAGLYVSVLDAQGSPVGSGYDPNSDILLAALHGAVPLTEPRLLAHAARLRAQWADPTAPTVYGINLADAGNGMGPLLGRYPGDHYDGDNGLGHPGDEGHPWAVTSAALAQLYYGLATATATATDNGHGVAFDDVTATFFTQIGIDATTSAADIPVRLRAAGDRILMAIVTHSNHLSLSEQFDKDTGYEKSVNDLTWSYAAFLSAVRAR